MGCKMTRRSVVTNFSEGTLCGLCRNKVQGCTSSSGVYTLGVFDNYCRNSSFVACEALLETCIENDPRLAEYNHRQPEDKKNGKGKFVSVEELEILHEIFSVVVTVYQLHGKYFYYYYY